jgi:hypothetical protein
MFFHLTLDVDHLGRQGAEAMQWSEGWHCSVVSGQMVIIDTQVLVTDVLVEVKKGIECLIC